MGIGGYELGETQNVCIEGVTVTLERVPTSTITLLILAAGVNPSQP